MPVEENIKSWINPHELKRLSVLRPWKSLFAIGVDWLQIIIVVILHLYYPSPYLYFFVWIVIGTRLYAFYSILHDAIHYSITRNKFLNDFIAQIFLGAPLLIVISSMRRNHLKHHKYLQSEDDPEMKHLEYVEFHFPKLKWHFALMAIKDLTGFNYINYKIRKGISVFSKNEKFSFMPIVFILLFIYLISLSGLLKFVFLYWWFPYITLYQFLNRVRLSTEHFYVERENYFHTRSVVPSSFERWLLVPHNLGYHIEHHLYPGVPFYNLPELHKLLTKHVRFNKYAVVLSSYRQLITNFIR